MPERIRNKGTWTVIALGLLAAGYFLTAFIAHVDSYKPARHIPFTVSKIPFTATVVEGPIDMIDDMQLVVTETPSLHEKNKIIKVEVVVNKSHGVHIGSILEVRTLRTYRHPGNDLPDTYSGGVLRIGTPITNDKAS